MFGLGKKTKPEVVQPLEDEIRITTIPESFYGAQSGMSKAPKKAPQPVAAQPAAPKPKMQRPGVHTPPHAAAAHKRKKWVLISVFVFVLIGVTGGATWWYTKDLQPQQQQPEQAVVVEVEQPEQPEQEVETETETEQEVEVELPKTLLSAIQPLADTIDFDSDNLTDIEEELYAGDISDGDTDGDGFLDGLEIIHLYDPTSSSPALLTDSDDVRLYTNTTYEYSMLYPVDWLAAPVNQEDPDEVLFTSLTGEFVAMRYFPFETGQTFVGWLNVNNPQVVFSSLKQWENRMGNTGWFEDHKQRYYFADTDGVYVIQYEPGVRSAINFRQTMRMMAESWNPSVPAPREVPEPLPGIQEGATSTPPTEATTSSVPVATTPSETPEESPEAEPGDTAEPDDDTTVFEL